MDKSTQAQKFSAYHPVIPKLYTPAWKLDMPNRARIVENCKRAGVQYRPTEASMYIEKRERITAESQEESNNSIEVPREKMLRPSLHSPLSKYQSSLMFRSN